MRVGSITPVLYIEEIESCLPFWTERLGFAVVAKVEDGSRLGFAILGKDDVQIMYQTHESLATDLPQLGKRDQNTSIVLYLEVDDLDACEKAMKGVPLVQERRKTFYGATEIAVREPGGNVIMFSHHAQS